MSSSSNGKKKKKDTTAAAEGKDEQVDEILRAAQDDMLLKLGLNSHMARGFGSSSQFSGIDPDLDSRFQALKKPHQPKSKSKSKSNLDAATTRIDSEKKNPDQSDDLVARFAALKGSLPSYSTSSAAAAAASAVGIGNISNQVQQQQVLMDDDNEEDEVERVIKWAIDAARLDPSPLSDSDDDDDDDHSDDDHSEDDTDDDRGVDAGKKSKRK